MEYQNNTIASNNMNKSDGVKIYTPKLLKLRTAINPSTITETNFRNPITTTTFHNTINTYNYQKQPADLINKKVKTSKDLF